MAKIKFEFDCDNDEDDIDIFQNAKKMYLSLRNIFSLARTELKHGPEELSDHMENLLERIREEAGQYE